MARRRTLQNRHNGSVATLAEGGSRTALPGGREGACPPGERLAPVNRTLGFLLCLLVCSTSVGCTSRVVRPDPLAARFAAPDAARARARAFDLYANAQRAHEDAEAADADTAEQADQRELALLLLLSAIAEAERLDFDEASAAAEARSAAALQERARIVKSALEVQQAVRRDEAARLAALEFANALGEAQRIATKSGKRTPDSKQRATHAGEVLGDRATLTLAAAIALGLTSEQSAGVEQLLASAEHAPEGEARLKAAHAALIAAERALDDARKARPAP